MHKYDYCVKRIIVKIPLVYYKIQYLKFSFTDRTMKIKKKSFSCDLCDFPIHVEGQCFIF